jgi:hypothetical protein
MKKFRQWYEIDFILKLQTYQSFKTMITTFVIAICSMQLHAKDTAINAISLAKSAVPLKEVLTEIEAQSRYHFFYNNQQVDDNRKVTVYFESVSLDAALEFLARGGESQIVNLGTGEGVTVREMVTLAARITGRDIPFEIVGRRAGDAASVIASSAKARELLGWKATRSDAETLLRTTWRAYLANEKGREERG